MSEANHSRNISGATEVRINVYSQELTTEVLPLSKESNTGLEYHAIQFILHSSPMLHHPPKDDDRSAVTFWLPNSRRGVDAALQMFEKAAELCRQRLKDAGSTPSGGPEHG